MLIEDLECPMLRFANNQDFCETWVRLSFTALLMKNQDWVRVSSPREDVDDRRLGAWGAIHYQPSFNMR